MSKLTNTEAALPKTGHVTEVCKEWLVREDGALAYKLQSQEITDFYKGNRFRNAVVREDFPTALQEQIKEKENAEKQADAYRKYLSEQEQHDKMMAKEIADKLERDLLEQQQREFEDSELIAQQMQEIYVNLPPPPPTIREKRPPPPRPEKKLSPEKYDQMVGNGSIGRITEKERLMQQHADDIELYVDPCDYESLQEIGLPMDEIKEMSKKLKQEQKDELLARRLQEMEQNDGLTQEERDRLLAIEAQDKELAKMLQEREKAKAKRAKEKARLRKNQYQKESSSSSSSIHCVGPIQSLPQDCLPSTSTSRYSGGVLTEEDDSMDLEPYSNPIDMITNQRLYGGGGGGSGGGTMSSGTSSLSRDISQHDAAGHNHRSNFHLNGIDTSNGGRDDDIYTLPVDSCRPTASNRPASLNIAPETAVSHHNSMTRSENFTSENHDMLSKLDVSPRMNHSKSGSFDQNSSPTPPYMPIQGTRRSNSSEERKKKTKDKCTHQ